MADRLVVGIGDAPSASELVRRGFALAAQLQLPWQVVHVETPETQGSSQAALAAALELAAQLGATIARVAASDIPTGLKEHLDNVSARHLVIGFARHGWRRRLLGRALLDQIRSWESADLTIHLMTTASPAPEPVSPHHASAALRPKVPLAAYGYAVLLVAVSITLALLLRPLVGRRTLDMLFLIPVVGVSALWGVRPGLLAVLLSVVSFNLLLLEPTNSFTLNAPQNLVLGTVLIAAMLYTASLTARLRRRAVLGDRTAQESAAVAAFAQDLTRASEWDATAQVVCDGLASFLDVQVALFRELDGQLVQAGSTLGALALNPVDKAALDACWVHGLPTGIGTETGASADWQFQPLSTQLGMLAVVGLAREDGTDPVPADKIVLLKTLTAQAALAHERLRLEDIARRAA